MFFLDLQSRTPIYEQIKNSILRMLSLGVLQPNQQLPSVRSVARDLGINPNTVQKAYQELEAQGILYSIAGKGSFIHADSCADNKHRRQMLDTLREQITEARSFGISRAECEALLASVYGTTETEKE